MVLKRGRERGRWRRRRRGLLRHFFTSITETQPTGSKFWEEEEADEFIHSPFPSSENQSEKYNPSSLKETSQISLVTTGGHVPEGAWHVGLGAAQWQMASAFLAAVGRRPRQWHGGHGWHSGPSAATWCPRAIYSWPAPQVIPQLPVADKRCRWWKVKYWYSIFEAHPTRMRGTKGDSPGIKM